MKAIPDTTASAIAMPHALSCLAARGGRLLARMIRKPNGARLTSDAALRHWYGIGLLVRHDLDRRGHPGRAIAFVR